MTAPPASKTPATASMAAHPAKRGCHHCHGQLDSAGDGMRRQPGIRRRLTGCGGVNELSLSGRVLGLHALQGRTKLPRPRQQWTAPQGQRSAIRRQRVPVPGRRASLAGAGYRQAGRSSNYKNTNVCRTATVHRLWCSRC